MVSNTDKNIKFDENRHISQKSSYFTKMTENPTTINLTEEQLQIIQQRNTVVTPGTQQYSVDCVRNDTNRFVESIHHGLTANPNVLYDGYTYKKNESFPIAQGDLNININIKFKTKKKAKLTRE